MRLSEFKDEKGIEVVAKLLIPISNIASDKEMDKVRKDAKNMIEFASAALQKHQKDVMNILAIVNDVEPAEYHCNAATVLHDVMVLFSDPDILSLFGLRRQTTASSGSASENTEAPTE